MNEIWELNVITGKNPVHTGQFLNSYDQREFTQEEVVAREGAQNAMDAGRNVKGVTELEFHSLKITGESKQKFIKLFEHSPGLVNSALQAFLFCQGTRYFSIILIHILANESSRIMSIDLAISHLNA